MRYGLITGIPRSGTTLAATILDCYNDVVCLSEPPDHANIFDLSDSADDYADRLQRWMADRHSQICKNGEFLDRRNSHGQTITNYFSANRTKQRVAIDTLTTVVRSGLSEQFFLCAKHNGLYAGVLPQLLRSGHFKVVSIVRHPVPVVASWQSLKLPISNGRLPAAERYWPAMQGLTGSERPLVEKQLLIFELLCRRFLEYGSDLLLLRYEDLVRRPEKIGEAFGLITPAELKERLLDLVKPHDGSEYDQYIIDSLAKLAAAGQMEATASLYPKCV